MTEIISTPNPWDGSREYESSLVELHDEGFLREEEIVWLEPGFPYIRERLITHSHRRTRPGKQRHSEERVVAYSTVAPDTKLYGTGFYRRVWYVMPWDPYQPWDPKLGGPMEAVDPATIRPNKVSSRPGHDLREPGPAGQRKADAEGMREGRWVSK